MNLKDLNKCLILFMAVFSISSSIRAQGSNLHIALMLWRGETHAERGFKDQLEKMGYEVQYTEFNAEQNLKRLGTQLRSLQSRISEFDYIYTFGTTVSRRARIIIDDRVPQIFNVVTNPVEAGIAKSFQSSGGNICGVSDAVSINKQIHTALQVFPITRLGVFYNPREKNSMIIRRELKALASSLGISVVDLRSVPESNMLQINLDRLIERNVLVDAVYLPPDSYLVSRAETIGKQLRKAQLKSLGSVKTFVEHGALLGVVVDYYHLGILAAQIIEKHQHGKELSSIPIVRDEQTILVINRSTQRFLNVSLTKNLEKQAVFID